MKTFTRLKTVAVALFLFLDFVILLLPYYINGYEPPVGWDTPVYIRHMNVIAERGFFQFFQYSQGINFYSVFAYLFSLFFQMSFVVTEKVLPIALGVGFPLMNFQIVRRMYRSWKLEVLVLTLSIVDFNVMRMVVDLHRNLFCLILVQVALFLFLPEMLRNPSKRKAVIFILLMTLAGLSQIETFGLAIVTLSLLFVFFLLQRSFPEAKLLLLLTIPLSFLVIVFMFPFLETFLETAVYFNPAFKFSYEAWVATPKEYFAFLGHMLIPFYILGLGTCLLTYMKNRDEPLFFVILVWNLFLVVGSFLPWFGIKIHGWRVLVLTTVPVLSTIGFGKLTKFTTTFEVRLKRWGIRLRYSFLACILVVSVLSTTMFYVDGVSAFYKPWISNEDLEKLTWINSYMDQDKPHIFVLYFSYGKWTKGVADVFKGWVKAIVDPKCQVYFGKVKNLLYLVPTKSSNPYVNQTAYSFWRRLEEDQLTLKGSSIYIIDDWYSLTPDSQSYLTRIYPGVFQVKDSLVERPYLIPTFLDAIRDSYNRTKNSYGLKNEWTRNWAQSEYVLESYEDPFVESIANSTYFQVNFMVLMSDEVYYTLKIRWFDYSHDYAPTTLSIDGVYIASFSYNDTYLPQTVKAPIPKVSHGWHLISLEIADHRDKVHLISLDYIEVVAEE